MSNRLDYVKYDEDSAELQEAFKKAFSSLIGSLEALPPGRAQALAITKLEEAYMWIGKLIRDEQLKRNANTEMQEERKDG